MQVTQVGDRDVGGGLRLEGAMMMPWLAHTLVSIPERVRDGWQWWGAGRNIIMVPPRDEGPPAVFSMKDDLFELRVPWLRQQGCRRNSRQGDSERQKGCEAG